MNCVSCGVCVYHLGLFVLFPRVFLSSRVTGACPVTTDLIMRVNVRTTTTTTTTTLSMPFLFPTYQWWCPYFSCVVCPHASFHFLLAATYVSRYSTRSIERAASAAKTLYKYYYYEVPGSVPRKPGEDESILQCDAATCTYLITGTVVSVKTKY